MAAIDDLIKQIEDPGLRSRIEQEFRKVSKRKKFGLVFEEHLPEATPLYDIPIKQGALVAEKQGEISDIKKVFIRLDMAGMEIQDKASKAVTVEELDHLFGTRGFSEEA